MSAKSARWVVVYRKGESMVFVHIRGKRDAKKLAEAKGGTVYTAAEAELRFGGAA